MQAEAGKGSKPRQSKDDEAYAEGYDRIFGKKKKRSEQEPEELTTKEINEEANEVQHI